MRCLAFGAALVASLACAAARAQGQSELEHVPPAAPQSHVHDMSYAEMAAMMGMDDRKKFHKVMLDRMEWRDADHGAEYGWDASAWYGGDFHKLWLQAEGERSAGSTEHSRLEAGWERIVGLRASRSAPTQRGPRPEAKMNAPYSQP